MRISGAARTAVAVCVLAASTAPARAANPVDDARAALQRHDAAGATATLEAFLAASKSDPRRPEARSLLAKAAGDWATDLDAHGDDDRAVRALLAAAKAIEPDPRAAELAGRAKRVLRAAYAAAVRQKAYDRALWAVTTWAADFGADKPLATDVVAAGLRAGAAADVVHRAGPAAAYGAVRDLLAANVPVDVIDRHGIDRAAIGVAYAALLQRDGWYAQAAAVAGETLAAGGLPPAGRGAVAGARSKAQAARADACLAFGDRSMAAAAIADFAAAADAASPSDTATAGRLHAALDTLDAAPPDPKPSIGPPPPPAEVVPPAPADPPPEVPSPPATPEPDRPPATQPGPGVYVPFQDLPAAPTAPPKRPTDPATTVPTAARPPATAPVVAQREPAPLQPVRLALSAPAGGEQAWVDGGSGYTLSGRTVQVGNCANDRGGPWLGGQVHLAPGFVLADGAIDVSSGTLHLDGTADRPVVLRRVRINCDYTASVQGRYAILEDCTFTKTGGWFWNGGYNTKWTLADCLLVGCRFGNLNWFDYGLKLDRCAVVGLTFQPRPFEGKATDDAASFFRGEWSHVLDCDFVDCGFPVSPLWMCVGCNFRSCRVTGPATFASRTPLTADLGVADDDKPFYDAAVAGTTTAGDGKLTYVREAKPFDRDGGPSKLWHLAPAWPAAAAKP